MLALILMAQFFDKPDVDFWGTRKRPEAPQVAQEPWAEPGHEPPAPVRRLLEQPTRENALAYLKWQEDRLARLQAAIKAVEDARPKEKEKEILYFTQERCPFCAEQDRQLAAADLGGRTVRRIGPEGEPELWKRHGVTATPTLVIDGEVLRGVQTRGQIEKVTK